MKLKTYLTIIILTVNFGLAQLSKKHWIPPLHCRVNTDVLGHYLYLSTQEVIPFTVTIKSGNGTLLATQMISSTAPYVYNIGNGTDTQIFVPRAKVNTVLSSEGLILEGSKDFYVSMRMNLSVHAEILVSKGKTGIGKSFRLGYLPMYNSSDSRLNFVSSVMATEDNTQINLSDYDPDVVFVSGAGNILDDTQNFTLNAGQTIVFSGYGNVPANITGFIGAKLTATKPVAVSTGNVFGSLQTNSQLGGADITLDQIVSEEQTGNEYVFVRGNGLDEMERPLIIANQDGTEIFINGSVTPILTLNAGEEYIVPSSYYQGVIGNQNMYIKSNKSVYAYQFIGGSNRFATSGLNFVPPLNCFYQRNVILPFINQIGQERYPTDLIILTYAGANVTINGIGITSLPQAVLGNPLWVSYRVPNQSGTINVVSTGPLAVGVFGYGGFDNNGDASVGFAGYFSGFGAQPKEITDVKICSSVLDTNLLEAIDGNPDPGGIWTLPTPTAPPLVNDIFNPQINIPGEYIYTFSKSCDSAPAQTYVLKVNVSIVQGKNPGVSSTVTICKNDQSRNIFQELGNGTTPGGTWTPALPPNGIFDPSQFAAGTYEYKYTIPAEDPCPELSATITFDIKDIPAIPAIADVNECDDIVDGSDTNGSTTFNLSAVDNTIIGVATNLNVKYYLTQNNALTDVASITNYTGVSTTIYVRVTNTITNCFNVSNFKVNVNPKPVVISPISLIQCDDDTDGISIFNLNEANSKISLETNLTIDYFSSEQGALNNDNSLKILDYTSFTSGSGNTAWARISNVFGCFRVVPVNLVVSATQIPANFTITLEKCDDGIEMKGTPDDGFEVFDLESTRALILAQLPAGQALNLSYYLTEMDALKEINKIMNTSNFISTIPNFQEIWVRIDSDQRNDCIGLGQFVDLIVNPRPNSNLKSEYVICVDEITGKGSLQLDAAPTALGTYNYFWTPSNIVLDANGNQSSIFDITEAGNYQVRVVNSITNCEKNFPIIVKASSPPVNISVQLITPLFSEGTATIQTYVTGGFGIYEYSIDGINWQDSPIFEGLLGGTYQVTVRDKEKCGELKSNSIVVITYPQFFTPNADGFNDFWTINLDVRYDAKLFIYDKYGKLLKQFNPYSTEGWDGTFNGAPLPATDYWFVINYIEDSNQKEFRSHFSLKR